MPNTIPLKVAVPILLAVAVAAGCSSRSGQDQGDTPDETPASGRVGQPRDSEIEREADSVPSRPPAIPEQLWTDLHWVPGNVVAISSSAEGEAPIVPWLLSLPQAESGACKEVMDGLHRSYGISWAEPGNSWIFIGSLPDSAVWECVHTGVAVVGATATKTADTIELRARGGSYFLGRRNGGSPLVAVVDRAQLDVLTDSAPGSLGRDAAYVRLLSYVGASTGNWFVTKRDLGTNILGIESVGAWVDIDVPSPGEERRTKIRGRLLFASPELAIKASLQAEALLKRLKEAHGDKVSSTGSRDEDSLVFDGEIAPELFIDPEFAASLTQPT